MVKKIDFILPQIERATQNAYITKWIAAGVQSCGVETRLLTPPQDKSKPQAFIEALVKNPPACTFCVNGILPDSQGNFLADLLQLPHVAYVTDSPTIYYSLCNSDFTIIATIDSEFQNIFAEVKGSNVLFLPGAAPSYIDPVLAAEDRSIDILMMPHLIDPFKIHEEWKKTLPISMVNFLEDCAHMVLVDKIETFTTSFLKGWQLFTLKEQEEFAKFRSLPLIHELEMYIRGLDQLELLKAFNGMNVDLLVQRGTIPSWEKLLKDHKSNFSFHEGSDFDTIFQKIKDSKIILNSSPQIKHGTDGMPFLSLIGGGFVFTSANNWLTTRYNEESGIYTYTYRDAKKIREKAEHLLENPEALDQAILIGRNKVIQEDTWNSRARQLLDALPDYLKPLAKRAPLTQRDS